MPAGIAVVGGAGVDPSGGGNGDPDGPAAPPDPVAPTEPGEPGRPAPGAGGTTVTLPDGTVVTLPPGVTAGTSGIRGVDFAAPAFLRKPRLSVTRFRAARRGRAFVAVPRPARGSPTASTSPRGSRSASRSSAGSAASAAARSRATSRHRTGTAAASGSRSRAASPRRAVAGTSSVRFRGRLKGRALKPGAYRFVIRARDRAGNVSKPRRPKFRIVR